MMKEDEMGRACGTHGREDEYLQGFGGKREGDQEDVGGRIILKLDELDSSVLG
jgi:hypothetical protein